MLDGLHEELAKWVQPCAVLLNNPEQLSVAGYAYVLCTYPCRYSESADVTVEESEGDAAAEALRKECLATISAVNGEGTPS